MASAIQFYLRQTGERQSAPDRQRTMSSFEEKIRHSIATGRAGLLPWVDVQSGESLEMRRAYRGFLRHPVVKAALLKKVYSVSALDLAINPATDDARDQEAAEFCLHAYTREMEGGFPKVCETLLIHGLMDGTGVSEPVWNESLASRGRWSGKRFYRDLKAKEDVELEVDAFRNITAVKSMRSSAKWEPEEFVIWRNMPLFEGPGLSDFRAAYGKLWMLDTAEKLRMIHLEKFTSPYFQGEYVDKADKANLEEELAKATSRSWVVVPAGTKIQAMQIAMRGEQEFQSAIKELKEDVALAIAGAFLDMMASSSQGGEMRGSAAVSRSTAELFVWRLAAVVQNVIDRQLTPRLIDHNFLDVGYPTASLGGINYGELLQSIQLEEIAQRMGFKVSRKAFGKKYALQEAADDGDALTPAAPASPFGGGLPFQFSDRPRKRRKPRQPCGCAAGDSLHTYCRQGVNAGKPGPCPTVGTKSKVGRQAKAAKDEPGTRAKATTKPAASKSKADAIKELLGSQGEGGLIGPKAKPDPLNLRKHKYPAEIDSDVYGAIAAVKSKSPLARAKITDVIDAVQAKHPNASVADIHASIASLTDKGSIMPGPYTQALATLSQKDLASVMPLDREAKFWLDVSGDPPRPKPPASKPAKAPKPADVKIKAAADKVAKINVKVTAAKAKLDTLKGELKAAKADLAAIKKSVPKKVSERAKANKEAAKGVAQKLEAYGTKWTNAADVEGKKAKNNRPDFSKQPTTEQMEADVMDMLGKTSPIEVAKSLGYVPKNRAQAVQYVREHVLTRIGMARRRYV